MNSKRSVRRQNWKKENVKKIIEIIINCSIRNFQNNFSPRNFPFLQKAEPINLLTDWLMGNVIVRAGPDKGKHLSRVALPYALRRAETSISMKDSSRRSSYKSNRGIYSP